HGPRSDRGDGPTARTLRRADGRTDRPGTPPAGIDRAGRPRDVHGAPADPVGPAPAGPVAAQHRQADRQVGRQNRSLDLTTRSGPRYKAHGTAGVFGLRQFRFWGLFPTAQSELALRQASPSESTAW